MEEMRNVNTSDGKGLSMTILHNTQLASPEDGKRSSFQNVVFSTYNI
jgi:hypothetical protein